MDPCDSVPRFLKVGKLHSPANLKLRAEYFEQKYGECMKTGISNSTEEDSPVKSSTYYQRYPQKGFKGFNYPYPSLMKFNMIQETIEEHEMHEQFTSDEESISDEELQPVSLSLHFDFEQGLTLEGIPIPYMNENGVNYLYSSDEDESTHRPVSRLSLEVDEKFDESGSEYDSDYFFCESEGEGEGEDNDSPKKKVIYGPVPGIAVGDVWRTRRQCSRTSIHVPCKSRIHAGVKAGCSIVLSSKEMVEDEGVLFTYKSKAKVGNSGSITTHQLIGANKALQNNFLKRIPIRVVRGYQLGNAFAPKKGYRYDGLYDVKAIIDGSIENGNQYCEVNLVRCPNQPPPPWASNNAPAGDVPGHLLSATEIDYTTGDESESVLSDIREISDSPFSAGPNDLAVNGPLNSNHLLTPVSAAECRYLDPRRTLKLILKKLSAEEIEKATNRVTTPKEPARKLLKRHIEPKKTLSEKHSRSSQTSKSTTPVLQQKTKVYLKAASKTAQGSSSKSDSTTEKVSKKLKIDISKGQNVQSKESRKLTDSPSLKRKDNTVSSNSQEKRLLDEKNVTSGTKKMAVKNGEGKTSTRNKLERVVSHNKEQKLAQSNRGIKLRSSGKRKP